MGTSLDRLTEQSPPTRDRYAIFGRFERPPVMGREAAVTGA